MRWDNVKAAREWIERETMQRFVQLFAIITTNIAHPIEEPIISCLSRHERCSIPEGAYLNLIGITRKRTQSTQLLDPEGDATGFYTCCHFRCQQREWFAHGEYLQFLCIGVKLCQQSPDATTI